MAGINDLTTLIKNMTPALNAGVYVFTTLHDAQNLPVDRIVALIREPEGISAILAEEDAQALGIETRFRCAWITLTVHSALEAIGLTAAFATALGNAGISCNVVAGHYHDHIFVPLADAERAMLALQALQDDA